MYTKVQNNLHSLEELNLVLGEGETAVVRPINPHFRWTSRCFDQEELLAGIAWGLELSAEEPPCVQVTIRGGTDDPA